MNEIGSLKINFFFSLITSIRNLMQWNQKYDYPKSSRATVDGIRRYLLGEAKLPSVTSILDATRSEEDKAALANWRERTGQKEAEAITKAASSRGSQMHNYLESYLLGRENLSFFEDISKIINSTNRPLIIFPQATRVLPEERPPFKKGASRVYEELKIHCQPIAINSGYVWPKKGEKKSNKTITISILKPIPSGLTKENFIQILEKNIYSELDLIN